MNSSGEEERYADRESSEDDDSDAEDFLHSQPLLREDTKEEPNYTEVKGPADPKDNIASSSGHSDTAEPVIQIVSNARGTFPQFEMFSVSPRRHNTVHGTGQRQRPAPRIIPGPPPPPPTATAMFGTSIPPPPALNTHMHNPFATLSPSLRVTQNITRRLADVSVALTHHGEPSS